ncbi:MarR family winged helix-turn-helix transcriptional regulator [Actinophytocola oryzae]|uniref:DNA-binding MarR family transcriptional regulator n=1 Tax=Actinophytocola oryzae TaxID=502181 RepID=A0A4R7VBG1_9PSEU|nr:MarR family winged helix-turn-helix transcriptional regulator [Actinophytocola oryzae]TDV46394.1 DNA-binding MarR family transcriptional regulator [Actinophytocola oryzae]
MTGLSPPGWAFSELLVEVFRVNGLLLAAGDRLAAPAGLTSARWQVLGVVDHGPTTVAQVARTMGLTRQSVRQTADALVRDGLVELVPNPADRRARLLKLTPEGRKALRYVEEQQSTWANAIAAHLPHTELRTCVGVLRDLGDLLEPAGGE